MPYWQLYYHVVWSTKNREPILTSEVEPIIYAFIRNKALDLEASVYALNGYLDHVHLVVSIPPKIAVSKFVGQVKAVASVRFNQSGHRCAPFYWQEEYGVFSLDRKRLPLFIAYVERQKEHHTNQQLIPALEKDALARGSAVHDIALICGIIDEAWVQEMLSYDH